MMTTEERLISLNTRMHARRRQKERRKTAALCSACAGLSLCLVLLVFGEGKAHAGGTAGQYSGTTVLFESAGGYVLLAIVAFMAGVIITTALIRKRNSEAEADKQEKKEEQR